MDERMSGAGVSLLALYGDDERLGLNFKKVKKGAKKAFGYTPWGAYYKGAKAVAKKIHGDERFSGDDRFSGDVDFETLGAFLPGLKKVAKKVGKVTSPITTGIAKTFIPAPIVSALAKVDPTKKGASTKAAVAELQKPAPKAVVPVPKSSLKIDTKKVLIVGGAGVGALILLRLLLGGHR
jgi:hypothetical protein